MEKELISSCVASIPTSELRKKSNDEEVWKETDGDAELVVSRHVLPTPNRDDYVSLTIRGPVSERQRVLRDFVSVFGEPFLSDLEPDFDEHVDTVSWMNKLR